MAFDSRYDICARQVASSKGMNKPNLPIMSIPCHLVHPPLGSIPNLEIIVPFLVHFLHAHSPSLCSLLLHLFMLSVLVCLLLRPLAPLHLLILLPLCLLHPKILHILPANLSFHVILLVLYNLGAPHGDRSASLRSHCHAFDCTHFCEDRCISTPSIDCQIDTILCIHCRIGAPPCIDHRIGALYV